jgi:hypothetical protein
MTDEPTEPDQPQGRKAERANNERAVKGRAKLLADVKGMLAQESGRRIAWWLLTEARVFRPAFHENPRESAYREGFRDMGLVFREKLIEADFTGYQAMEREGMKQEKTPPPPAPLT